MSMNNDNARDMDVVTHSAAYYLQTSQNLDATSQFILRAISILDEQGAQPWNLRTVALVSFVTLGTVRVVLQKKRGIDWYAWIHAVVSALASFACLYLDYMTIAHLTGGGGGPREPLRSIVQCQGPLTSLHRIVPAITMGYSIFDLFDGYLISIDFLLHGGLTLAVMAYFCEVRAPHVLAPMLVMEGSTVFLNMVKADFFPDILVILNQACFVLSFFLCRIVIVPYIWANLMMALWRQHIQSTTATTGSTDYNDARCFPPHFMPVCFLFGMFYNLLNVYWFNKIARKAIRRMRRIERHTEKNSLQEFHDKVE